MSVNAIERHVEPNRRIPKPVARSLGLAYVLHHVFGRTEQARALLSGLGEPYNTEAYFELLRNPSDLF